MKILISALLFVLLVQSIFSQQIPNLPIPLGAGTAQVYNNQIFYFGGSNNWAGNIVYPRVYRFDGTSWSYYDTIPDNNLWGVCSAIIGDNVYLIGGWPNGASRTRKYNITTKQWTTLANSPNTYTYGITTELINNKIYLINSNGKIWEYNISDNTWTEKASLGVSGYLGLSSIVYNDEIYVLGFYNRVFYKYNTNTNTWSRLTDTEVQLCNTSMGIINNFVYCAGGNNGGTSGAAYNTVRRYDINTNTWAVDSRTLLSKRHWMAHVVYKGGMYVLGGFDSTGNAVNTVEEIVPQGTATNIDDNLSSKPPKEFNLYQNYPNPFNPTTTIEFTLAEDGLTTLKIYDVLGREVQTLVNEELKAGQVHRVKFDGSRIASGIYFYKLEHKNRSLIKKFILIK